MDRQFISDEISKILRKHDVRRGALFGSFSRASDFTATSDIDVLVDLPPMDLFDFIGLKQELEEAVGRNVDLVQYKKLRPQLRDSILASAVPLFG